MVSIQIFLMFLFQIYTVLQSSMFLHNHEPYISIRHFRRIKPRYLRVNAPLAIGQPYQILRIVNPLRTELRDVVRILLHYVMPGVSLV